MRNEIFEKISQSRKRYLAELNQELNRKEPGIEKPVEVIKQTEPIRRDKSAAGSLKKLQEIDWGIKEKLNIVLRKIPIDGIKGMLNELTGGLQQKLKKSNQRFSSHSDKFMKGFVSYSNRIFEDRYEGIDPDYPIMNRLGLETATSRQMTWEFADPNTHRDFIPAYSESRLGDFFTKIENSFVKGWKSFLFSLEFEGTSLEVNQNKPSEDVVCNENTKTIGIGKSQFGSSRLVYSVDIVHSANCKARGTKWKLMQGIGKAEEIVNWICLFLFKVERLSSFDSIEKHLRYGLTKFLMKPKSKDFDITQRSQRL